MLAFSFQKPSSMIKKWHISMVISETIAIYITTLPPFHSLKSDSQLATDPTAIANIVGAPEDDIFKSP